MSERLMTLTSDIVASHVSYNSLSADELPTLISNVYSALARLDDARAAGEARPDPAVPVRASVKRDHIVCLECGKKMKMLKRHLSAEHGMSPEEYRKRWDLAPNYPIVAPNYASARRELAKRFGLGNKPNQKRSSTKKA